MWSEPIYINDEVEAILLDTEGLHSTDQQTDIDTKIFTLSVLLSSIFLFNQIGHITEQNIEEMSLTLNLAQMLTVGGASEDQDLSHYLPMLLWVLRDFSLDLGAKTSHEYLEQSLA